MANPILGFLSATTTGSNPRDLVTKNLRLLGILVLVGAAVAVLMMILGATVATSAVTSMGAMGPAAGAATMIVIVFTLAVVLAISGAILFWITYTINAWTTGNPSGSTHALVLGILAAVFGGLGVLQGVSLLFASMTAFSTTTLMGLPSLAVAGLACYCGVMILMNRSKVSAPGMVTA